MAVSSRQRDDLKWLLSRLDDAEALWTRIYEAILYERNVVIAVNAPSAEESDEIVLRSAVTDLELMFTDLQRHFGAEEIAGPPAFVIASSTLTSPETTEPRSSDRGYAMPKKTSETLRESCIVPCVPEVRSRARNTIIRLKGTKCDRKRDFDEPVEEHLANVKEVFEKFRKQLRRELAPKKYEAMDDVPSEYRDGGDAGGEPLTTDFVGIPEEYGLKPSYLSKHFGEGKELTDRLKVGRMFVYRYDQIAALSAKRTKRTDRRQ